jgi:hypothetical protein
MKNFTEPAAGTDIAVTARDLAIDLTRFICLALVVVGHCMMTSPVLHPDGTVTTENTLAEQGLVRAGHLGLHGDAAVLCGRGHHRAAVLAAHGGARRQRL